MSVTGAGAPAGVGVAFVVGVVVVMAAESITVPSHATPGFAGLAELGTRAHEDGVSTQG